ncbi:Hypothetical predicted protein, partial [Olea europaea subsp. europaea]
MDQTTSRLDSIDRLLKLISRQVIGQSELTFSFGAEPSRLVRPTYELIDTDMSWLM